jgi:hypothetical protein
MRSSAQALRDRRSSLVRAGKWRQTRKIGRGAQCLPEQPLVPADNCVFKSKASHEVLAFATASPASEEPAVSSQR